MIMVIYKQTIDDMLMVTSAEDGCKYSIMPEGMLYNVQGNSMKALSGKEKGRIFSICKKILDECFEKVKQWT